jgi:hypothetical protein
MGEFCSNFRSLPKSFVGLHFGHYGQVAECHSAPSPGCVGILPLGPPGTPGRDRLQVRPPRTRHSACPPTRDIPRLAEPPAGRRLRRGQMLASVATAAVDTTLGMAIARRMARKPPKGPRAFQGGLVQLTASIVNKLCSMVEIAAQSVNTYHWQRRVSVQLLPLCPTKACPRGAGSQFPAVDWRCCQPVSIHYPPPSLSYSHSVC